ncbi:uncharacterized protein LOC117914382 isoform X3 [Vitis riparia]|uniref:uncharacterized protein LOC117914382 isoform X3 n=1 Tax=Vitis riparia TaxID=96939 RepID=UPI00155A34E9|nr:uncharacterized protein LOC117914382 isoform X3 [Vitis riparia]
METKKVEGPPSPARPPVDLANCVEELVKYTLSSSVNGTLEIDLGLSKDYCSALLKDDHLTDPTSISTDSFEGVPPYPLYKRLSAALYQSIISGAFWEIYSTMALIHEDSSLKQKEEWNKLVVDKGLELVNILKTIDFELHVQEPFFSQLKDGLKIIEGRCAVGDYNRIGSGALILFNKCLVLEVQLLESEGLAEVLPGVKTIEEGVQIYRKFYTKEKERSNGVLAICVAKPAAQPYIFLAYILFGLSYGGVQRLLGFMHTVGTIPEALPPPRSTLLLSFMSPYKPNISGLEVESCTLTDGARALAKHVNRSSQKFWGNFDGSDSNKNQLAMDVITRVIANCCWLNMHIVPPHGAVFEIRVADGYGARWSQDGTKFIGFLEPYMEDGHLRGWKH